LRTRNFLKSRTALLLFVPVVLSLLAGVPTAAASSSGHAYPKPSSTQLKRMHHLEPYIRYFSSLSYGPQGAKVSADYIRALVLTESAGHKAARSGKGALGVTQIIPSTARIVVRELARDGYDFLYIDEGVFERFEARDLYDPALNLLIACYLSATYHDKYDGDTELVVSAWNAGPGAVARYGNKPPPYKETRGMIGRMLGLIGYLETTDDL